METASLRKASRCLAELLQSEEGQVHFLVKFLTHRGRSAASEMRNRLAKDQPVHARGYHFKKEVIAEALRQWQENEGQRAPASWTGGEDDGKPRLLRRLQVGRREVDTPKQVRLEQCREAEGEGGATLTRAWLEMAQARRKQTSRTMREDRAACSTPRSLGPSMQRLRPAPTQGLHTPEKVSTTRKRPSSGGYEEATRKCQRADKEPTLSAGRWVSSPQPAADDGKASGSVKELKALLEEHGVNFAGCLEKSELRELWDCFLELCQKPLASLQAQVSQLAGPSGPRFPDVPSCARFLVAKRAPRREPEQADEAEARPRPVATPRVAEVASSRDREAQEEVLRILPLRREDFRSPADWGFAVLGLGAPQVPDNAAAVQRSYRNLMRKLHPDKVLATDGVERSIQLIREAKDICEKSFSRIEPPMAPQSLRYEVLDSKVGHRRYQLRWLPPPVQDAAPVCRYLVSALDPAYGKPLTITVLEPDYSEELRRFVTTEELTSFVLAETDLKKMPSLWKQPTATVHVAAANEAGQSRPAKLEIRLAPSMAWSPSSSDSESTATSSSGLPRSPQSPDFEEEIQKRSGPELRRWLQKQLKAPLVAWLKTLRLPTSGTKEDLVERVLDVIGM